MHILPKPLLNCNDTTMSASPAKAAPASPIREYNQQVAAREAADAAAAVAAAAALADAAAAADEAAIAAAAAAAAAVADGGASAPNESAAVSASAPNEKPTPTAAPASSYAGDDLDDDRDAANPGNQLYVRGLGFRCTEEDVRELFEPYGPIQELSLVRDPHLNECRGRADAPPQRRPASTLAGTRRAVNSTTARVAPYGSDRPYDRDRTNNYDRDRLYDRTSYVRGASYYCSAGGSYGSYCRDRDPYYARERSPPPSRSAAPRDHYPAAGGDYAGYYAGAGGRDYGYDREYLPPPPPRSAARDAYPPRDRSVGGYAPDRRAPPMPGGVDDVYAAYSGQVLELEKNAEMAVRYLQQIVAARAPVLRSGWKAVLAVYTAMAARKTHEPLFTFSFDAAKALQVGTVLLRHPQHSVIANRTIGTSRSRAAHLTAFQ
ncbi:hypothetical protein AMAG_18609 [Allomyces macrogynus ATCC 38327]|uniref:RRM domain-containing protein n=1 Tax=Allomyces macrogynus (strain ATCC 38327) TaxID=578462 RepID=A0A0L0SED4_ALLM3|nr:hypothetical protein, variant [Allomyces macrogynus ATCC 38327]KNE60802.1 hypothetical protein AMAG_18609 [Allomyces macrogynus ATCC 38327]|eukprot:KNE60801.1 hypothetical protein, variant [Allomyces macrogynus ATCC 38327]